MIEKVLEAHLFKYQIKVMELRKNIQSSDIPENLANYELGRFNELSEVISDLEAVLKDLE